MKTKLERIMEVITGSGDRKGLAHCRNCDWHYCDTCPQQAVIAVILSKPDTIEVEGVEWVPIEFECGDYFVGKAGADGWTWGNMTDVNPDRSAILHYAPTAESALRAANAAIKEAK